MFMKNHWCHRSSLLIQLFVLLFAGSPLAFASDITDNLRLALDFNVRHTEDTHAGQSNQIFFQG